MQTLEFKNYELAPIANFLGELKLKARASRGRSKLFKLIFDKNKEYNEELDDVRKAYYETDGNGNFKMENGDRVLKKGGDVGKLNAELQEVMNEKAVINCTEYLEKFNALYQELLDYPYELDNQTALIYDLLMDELEKLEKEGN
ncbi:hypothetical protein FC48_GL000981 [Ligilactobacillus murinus DSM 20452 = NBRC 14221]|uniref:DUF1617 family protein n=1 Tax=Ligilactobacillus murinus DSM 20452 = NBRC 14221 TaxID=1423772 RepID=A0A0R2BCS6_9LACO|nr:DUF1617 family protein [Ligilactobacillus murinus]KRM73708.1 hypothetical protein FC48_GL000981 [Ligilactobacillus murinus DSM 20452 = NBRC 14221]